MESPVSTLTKKGAVKRGQAADSHDLFTTAETKGHYRSPISPIGERIPAAEPTSAMPGTSAKVAVLEYRASVGQELWRKHDAPHGQDTREWELFLREQLLKDK